MAQHVSKHKCTQMHMKSSDANKAVKELSVAVFELDSFETSLAQVRLLVKSPQNKPSFCE